MYNFAAVYKQALKYLNAVFTLTLKELRNRKTTFTSRFTAQWAASK